MWLLALACRAASPVETAPFSLVEVARVASPTAIVSTPGDPPALYITQQEGRIWRVASGRTELALDITDRVAAGGEKGLLGMSFAPTWPSDPRVFVNYTSAKGGLHTVVASFTVDGTSHRGAPDSEVLVLRFDQPYPNHNSGPVHFGPDGYLYVTTGDGGSGGDPQGNGQNLGVLLGKILRLDVSVSPYRVPPDNPFVGKPGARPEIWAYGVRNPWGVSFDAGTLWFADVGQNAWEEVNVGESGANYGWNRMEGTHCYRTEVCDRSGLTMPVAEYGHDLGQSITGGVVYRGPSIPVLDGRFVYADFLTGRLWVVRRGEAPVLLTTLPMSPSSFGVDSGNRLHVADYQGVIWRIDPR